MQNTVYFSNAGEIELDAIRVMGVSAKDTKNPIGMFGTGLKFAIATLLRTGHEITLSLGTFKSDITFYTKPLHVRDSKFQQVFMDHVPLPFTTELGKGWDVWMAYRELHSNCIDEGGTISDQRTEADTVFAVKGDECYQQFLERDKLFLPGKPIWANENIEVHANTREGGGGIYYRGVLAGAAKGGTKYAYNILREMKLSEDRHFASLWDVEWLLQTNLPTTTDQGILDDLLGQGGCWDQCLDFTHCHNPSAAFLAAAEGAANAGTATDNVQKLLVRNGRAQAALNPALPDQDQHLSIVRAALILSKAQPNISYWNIGMTDAPLTEGVAFDRAAEKFIVSRTVIDKGPVEIAGAVFKAHMSQQQQMNSTQIANELTTRLFNEYARAV